MDFNTLKSIDFKKYFHQLLSILIFNLLILSTVFSQSKSTWAISKSIQIHDLGDSIFIHESIHDFPQFGPFPSNGLIIVSQGKALMIDTPVDEEETINLYNYFLDSLDVKISHFIPGHFHDDCIGGLTALHKLGVSSMSFEITHELSTKNGFPVAQKQFGPNHDFEFNGRKIICNYFGPGHTEDNITIWIPENKILFGGCLVKSLDYKGTGNLKDANPKAWPATLKKIASSFLDVKVIVPGHGMWGGKELLKHSIDIFENYNNLK